MKNLSRPLEAAESDLGAILNLLRQIDEIDLSQVAAEMEARKSVKEKEAERLLALGKLGPKKKKNNRPKGRRHWKMRKRLEREKYYAKKKPRRAALKAELLREEGWYGILAKSWTERNVGWEITRDDWETYVGSLDDCVPMVTRYDSSLPARLDNVLIRDRDTLRVVFCGLDWKLKKLGYAL